MVRLGSKMKPFAVFSAEDFQAKIEYLCFCLLAVSEGVICPVLAELN